MKRTMIGALIAAFILTPTIISAQAEPSSELSAARHKKAAADANGNIAGPCVVQSRKTSAKAVVGCAHVAAFQAYVDDLEGGGATIYFMGGTRRGKCWSGGLHPCGKALDVCQLSRGRVAAKCHLPGRQAIAAIASRHGLFEGGQWCSSDYGHAQVGTSAEACGTSLMARSKRQRHASPSSVAVNFGEWRDAH